MAGHMERVYVGPSEPKGPYKPTLWIKNDNVGNMAIYIRVGGSYVKFNSGSGDDETLYINATMVENPTQDLVFTIDKTQEQIDDAIRKNKLIMFSLNYEEGNKIQCSNMTTLVDGNSKIYIFEYTNPPTFSSSSHNNFAFGWTNGVFMSATQSEHIPELAVDDNGSGLNYLRYGGGLLSVNVDDTTIGINENNQLCILNNNNND